MIQINLNRPEATARISSEITLEVRNAMQQPLIEHKDVFAWSHEGMPRIAPEVIQHSLSVDPKTKGVRQKGRSVSAENSVVIVE